MRILIVDEMPAETAGLARAFEGSGSGARLEKLLGLQSGELSLVVDTQNLVAKPSSYDPRTAFQAACEILIEEYDRVVLCGSRVARAFRMHDAMLFRWLALSRDSRGVPKFYAPASDKELKARYATYAVVARIPHPSRLGRCWNDPNNLALAREFMAGLGLARRLF